MVVEREAVVCDVCKREFAPDDLEAEEFHHVQFTGGYESVFGDGTRVECDICQHCLKTLIGEHCRRMDPAAQQSNRTRTTKGAAPSSLV